MPGKPLESLSGNPALGSWHGSAPGAEHPVGQDLSCGREEQEEEQQQEEEEEQLFHPC